MSKAGIILCGGHSQRMGQPKAWLPFGNELLLQRVVRIVGEAVDRVVVVAAAGQSLPPLPGTVQRIDDQMPDSGPLAGLAAGLDAVEADGLFLSACDAPFLRSEFVAFLLESLAKSNVDAAVPYVDDYYPLSSAYRRTIRPIVNDRLHQGQLRMKDLFRSVSHQKLKAPAFTTVDPELESLRNINTPDDYESALIDYNTNHGTKQP